MYIMENGYIKRVPVDIYKKLQSIDEDAKGWEWASEAHDIADAIRVNPKLFLHCRYCGFPSEDDKGEWGVACRECKDELTEKLRHAKERLMAKRYNYRTHKWIGGLTRHFYEYDWDNISPNGKPRLDYKYVNPYIPVTAKEIEEIG